MTGYSASYMLTIYSNAAATAVLFFAAKALLLLRRERPDKPLAYLSSLAPDTFNRAALFFSSILFFVFLAPIKSLIPRFGGFFADPFLAAFDRAIFGRDAWEVAHFAHLKIDLFYTVWPLIIQLCALWVAVSAPPERLRRFFLGWALCFWVLGIGLAFMLASAGPIFGPELGHGFERLRAATSDARYAIYLRDSLWQTYASNSAQIGGGISAAPSMHCALTFLFVLAMKGTRLFVPAFCYAAAIWFGSIYLGWHYFVDGLISLVVVPFVWRMISEIDYDNDMPAERLTFRSE